MFQLYGDGVRDDTAAIQQMLDTRTAEVYLPAPQECYLISRTLKLHPGQTLRTAPTTRIRLADDSNCAMLENDDFDQYGEDLCVDGGIWDMNNVAQEPNPWHFPGKDGLTSRQRLGWPVFGTDPNLTRLPAVYSGFCMRFCRVRRFTLKNVTFRNPVTYGVQIAYAEDFTVRDIRFDYPLCNPKHWNMDGVHIEGHCKHGLIANLKGTVHDDLVAITADDGLYGPIENIVVDGVWAENAHSAVRLLSHGLPVKNIVLRNIFGSYYTYCIGLTKYYGGPEERGDMRNILIENVAACACPGTKDVAGGNHPLLWVQNGVDVDGLRIENVYREESTFPTPLLRVDATAHVTHLHLNNIVQKNLLGKPIPFLQLDGQVDTLLQGYTQNS